MAFIASLWRKNNMNLLIAWEVMYNSMPAWLLKYVQFACSKIIGIQWVARILFLLIISIHQMFKTIFGSM